MHSLFQVKYKCLQIQCNYLPVFKTLFCQEIWIWKHAKCPCKHCGFYYDITSQRCPWLDLLQTPLFCDGWCVYINVCSNATHPNTHLTSCNPPQAQHGNAAVFPCYTRALFSDAGAVPLFSQQTVTEKYEFVRSFFVLCFGSSHSRIEASPPCHSLSVCVFSLFRQQHSSGVPAGTRNLQPQISAHVAEKARLIQRPPGLRGFFF